MSAANDRLADMMHCWRKGKMREMGVATTIRTNAHPERDLQNECVRWLTARGICFVRLAVNPSTFYINGKITRLASPMKGWPDLACIIPVNGYGQFCGLEFKATTSQSEDQKAVQRRIEAANGRYFVIRSLEQMIRIFHENNW